MLTNAFNLKELDKNRAEYAMTCPKVIYEKHYHQ